MGSGMSLRNWVRLNVVVFMAYGLGLLAVPDRLMSFAGVTLNPGGILLARLLAAVLLGNAVMLWYARGDLRSPTFRGLIVGNVLAQVVATAFALYYVVNGTLNILGLALVAIGLVIGSGWLVLGWLPARAGAR